jgi:hypothetical protein
MELTRRDAVAAIAALGGAGGVAVGYGRLRSGGSGEEPGPALPAESHVIETMTAVAEVVYPSELTGIESFVETFLERRLDGGDHAVEVRETVARLDDLGESWHDGRVVDLPLERREELLYDVGADTAEEDPTGTTAERVRYYVVNELLLALYASPTGGELVGIENPQGHPGGTATYQQGPPAGE